MYLRHTIRKKDGKVHRYWCLVRSVRVGKRVIQQTVAHLGELDDHGRMEARALARHLIGAPEQAALFDDGSRDVTVPVRLKGIRIERSRQFGDVYLALALWRGVGLADLCDQLLPTGKERVAWEKIASVLVAARLCAPSSELHIAEDWYRRTALADLLQLDDALLNKDRLYRALDKLLGHKAAIEVHLSRRAGELFAVDNEVLLYDVTSTYFEGQAEAKPPSLAVLSPYQRQAERLAQAIEDERKASLTHLGSFRSAVTAGLLAGTVDSFQGSEADLVIVSLVRNNGDDGARALGFLRDARRMNVLLSRARWQLVLVGSRGFFRTHARAYGKGRVAPPELGCIGTLMGILDRLEREQLPDGTPKFATIGASRLQGRRG